ncbi:hypothetical protein ACH5RR_032972 [Cinchona calisaya]|uniref:F-box domain-containing protein n=1 Tax=Cinchona calisaya TaxID=153742 RepID=A0ABD2YJM5_9GENT
MAESSSSRRSELPCHLIHHILSFLPEKESTKASVLSKAWFRAWQTRPKLEFNASIYIFKKLQEVGNGSHLVSSLSENQKKEIYEELFKKIKKTLKPYSRGGICIDTVNLAIRQIGNLQWNPLVQKCAKGAVKNGVRNLDFCIPECDLPGIVFRAKSLVDLRVSCANITPFSVREIMCCGLKKLCLRIVNLNAETFGNIIESCPLIEILEVGCIMGFDHFKVTKLNNLKEITIWLLENQRVEVEAPNLELLTWHSEDVEEEEEEEEEEGVVRQMTCWITLPALLYQNLKTLMLRNIRIMDKFFLDLARKFPSLENLRVISCKGLQRIKISNRSLKKILLMDNCELVEAQFDVPSIVSFEYYSNSDIIPQFLFAAASSGWTSFICITVWGAVETSWFVKLKGLVAGLSQSEISIKIQLNYSVAFDLDEIGNIATIHEHQEVQELSLPIDDMFYTVPDKVSILNGLFWVCRPNTVNTYWIETSLCNMALKSFYEMLMFRRIQDRFHDLPKTMHWQHDLMEVNVEVFKSVISPIRGYVKFGKEGKKELQQKDLDWEDFLNVLRKNGTYSRMIYFTLEWRTVICPEE